MAVIGPEHYMSAFAGVTCLASPLYGRGGELLGAIDLSTSVQDAHPDQLASVIGVAAQIERALCVAQSA